MARFTCNSNLAKACIWVQEKAGKKKKGETKEWGWGVRLTDRGQNETV